MEHWTPIPGWESQYEVSDQGRVRSLDMHVAAGRNGSGTALRKGRVLTLVVKGGRYFCVTLARGEERKQYLVHDLVALAFHGPKPPGLEVRHLNDDKTNNTPSNLQYGTRQENEDDRQRNGKVRRGVNHGCAKLTEENVQSIRSSPLGPNALADEFGVTAAHIHAVRTRRVWRHI